MFSRTRKEAWEELLDFLPKAGTSYAKGRNHDFGNKESNKVSYLSPYLRHRLICEEELVAEVLSQFSLAESEKFVQEVCWRTYFKGYLEIRPTIWQHYKDELAAQKKELSGYQLKTFEKAIRGETEIEAFNHWIKELNETNTLHNHSRMWFASIWIFTLNLPWVLGAELFMEKLFDGDPASNTLSWRWVAGLHTKGKHYLARRENIRKFTNNRFDPTQLNEGALPLEENHTAQKEDLLDLNGLEFLDSTAPLLVTEDDLLTQEILKLKGLNLFFLSPAIYNSPYCSEVLKFKKDLFYNQIELAKEMGHNATFVETKEELSSVIGQRDISMALPNEGYCKDFLLTFDSFNRIAKYRRRWDSLFYPQCTAGFFKVKKQIPKIVPHFMKA